MCCLGEIHISFSTFVACKFYSFTVLQFGHLAKTTILVDLKKKRNKSWVKEIKNRVKEKEP